MRHTSLLIILFSLVELPLFGQQGNDIWRSRIDSLIDIASTDYLTYINVLEEVRYDSMLMEDLRAKAIKRKRPVAESFALNRIGTLYRRNNQFDSAFVFHTRAFNLAKNVQDTLGQIVALNSKGIAFRNSERIIEALEAQQAAITLASSIKNPNEEVIRSLAIAYDSKGRIYQRLEQYDLARIEFEESMRLEKLIGSKRGLAINHFNLATVNEFTGNLDKALSEYRIAISLNEEINSQIGLGINSIGMARVLTKQESYGMALRFAREALPLVKSLKDDFYTTKAELAYGDVLFAVGNLEEAIKHAKEAEIIAENRGYISEKAQALVLMSKIEEKRGNVSKAFDLYRQADQLAETVVNEKNQRYVAALSAQYDSELKEAEIVKLAQENELVRERARRTSRNFIGLVVLLILLATILSILYRQRKLVLQRDLVQLEQQRLASQMNPHFLFNALNSVKSYMISNESDAAIEYLSKFAMLMRRILSSTIDEEVPLSEEIENSRLYVAVENARFNEEIQFDVVVDDEVNIDKVNVPPLMLQPFLENALWHGLRMKQGFKLLELEVKKQKSSGLCLIVRDNGIGRVAAKRDSSDHVFKRRSVGLDITRQRMRHFARKRGRQADFEIIDLTNEDGSSRGTEVVITIA